MPKVYARTYLMPDLLAEERKQRIAKLVITQFTKTARAAGVELVGEPVVEVQPNLFTDFVHVTIKQFIK